MLVLSRHIDESIMIGDDVVVTIINIMGDKVRLGIEAPQDIPIHRQEVYEAIKRENEKASRLQPSNVREVGKSSSGGSGSDEENPHQYRPHYSLDLQIFPFDNGLSLRARNSLLNKRNRDYY